MVKNLPVSARRREFNPWVGKIPWRRKWQPTPVFLPGESHGQRSLVGPSPWGRKRVWHDLATKQKFLPQEYAFPLSGPLVQDVRLTHFFISFSPFST